MSELQTRPTNEGSSILPLSDDLLHGADEISRFVYGQPSDEKAAESNRRRVYHASDKHGLPTFKLGGTITARRSTILKWIERQERVR